MNQINRKERITAITVMLTKNPNKVFPLSKFSRFFGAAKSTLSEDVQIIGDVLRKFDMGELEVRMGAGGGVRYLPRMDRQSRGELLNDICEKLSDKSRILPGNFMYTADILMSPQYVDGMARILWDMFSDTNPDVIVTIETKGIPLAMSVARLFGKPLVVARKESKLTEGSVVTINYLSGSSKRLQTMSLSKRAVSAGQRALVIDDFLAGGGTIRAVFEMMKEFGVTVVGCGIAIATKLPAKKRIESFKNLFILENIDEDKEIIKIVPNPNI